MIEIEQKIKPVNQFGEIIIHWSDDRWETLYDAKLDFNNLVRETLLKNFHWTPIGTITDTEASFYYFDDVLNKNIEICYCLNNQTEDGDKID